MASSTPNAAELATVSYLTGISSTGTVASQSFWTWNNDEPPTYSTSGSSVHKWSNNAAGQSVGTTSSAATAGGTVTYAFNPLDSWTAAQQQAFVAALTLWSDEANIKFSLVGTSGSADVLLSLGSGTGTYEDGAPAVTASIGSTKISNELTPSAQGGQAQIVFDTTGGYGTLGSFAPGGDYGYSAVVHEAGHLLGLGHSGAYNDDGTQTSFDQNQTSAFDSRQWSVMSYLQPDDSSAKDYAAYTVTGTNWLVTTKTQSGNTTYSTFNEIAPQTPMMLDILAAQQLYGAPASTALSGGQVFGFNCNIADASEPFFDFSINQAPVLTLWDAGTGNTLDLSGYSTASTVNLNPGTFSSVDGLTNNLGIAFNTAIDTFVGGSGNDVITVNGDNDRINGGGGTNTAVFAGASSQYRITPGAGGTVTVTDLVAGRNGTDTLSNVQSLAFTDRTVVVTSTLGEVSTDLNGDGKSDILLQTTPGSLQSPNASAVIYSMSGGGITAGTSLGTFAASTRVVATGDFNGDGTADVLVAGPNTSLTLFTVQNDHYTAGYSLGSYGAAWSVVGTGDFNGDGKTDILMQNIDGSLVCFTMNGGSIVAGTSFGNFGPLAKVVGIGDFNGDGTSDLLVSTGQGTLTEFNVQNDHLVSGTTLGTYSTFRVTGVGDFNGDGNADILLQNTSTYGAVIFNMNGGSIIGSAALGNLGQTQVIATGDYNGDGTSDIVTQFPTSGALTEFQINNDALTAGYSLGDPGTAWQAISTGVPTPVITSSQLGLSETPDAFLTSGTVASPTVAAATTDAMIQAGATTPSYPAAVAPAPAADPAVQYAPSSQAVTGASSLDALLPLPSDSAYLPVT